MRTVFEWFVRIFLFGPLILGGIMFLISMFSETAKTKKKANKENQDRNSMNVFADRLVEKMAEKSGSSWDAMAAQFVKGGQYFYIGKNSVSLTKENKFSPNAYLVTVSYEQDMGAFFSGSDPALDKKMEYIAKRIAEKIPAKTIVTSDMTVKETTTNGPATYRTEVGYETGMYGQTKTVYKTTEVPQKSKVEYDIKTHGYKITLDTRPTAAPAESRKLTQL